MTRPCQNFSDHRHTYGRQMESQKKRLGSSSTTNRTELEDRQDRRESDTRRSSKSTGVSRRSSRPSSQDVQQSQSLVTRSSKGGKRTSNSGSVQSGAKVSDQSTEMNYRIDKTTIVRRDDSEILDNRQQGRWKVDFRSQRN